MMKRILFALFFASATFGCSKQFNAIAPAPDPNYVYIVGAHQGKAAAWVCPTSPGKDCVEITVHEDEQ